MPPSRCNGITPCRIFRARIKSQVIVAGIYPLTMGILLSNTDIAVFNMFISLCTYTSSGVKP